MNSPTQAPVHPAARVAHILMALCLGVMAVAVFFNVVLRYGHDPQAQRHEDVRHARCGVHRRRGG